MNIPIDFVARRRRQQATRSGTCVSHKAVAAVRRNQENLREFYLRESQRGSADKQAGALPSPAPTPLCDAYRPNPMDVGDVEPCTEPAAYLDPITRQHYCLDCAGDPRKLLPIFEPFEDIDKRCSLLEPQSW